MVFEVFFFVFGEAKLEDEVGEECDADPELECHVGGVLEEGYVFECVV